MTIDSLMHDDHDHEHDHEHEHDERTETIQLWIKTALLFGLGIYFAYNIASGNLANYINARFAWLSYVASALFLLIGLFSAIHLLRDHAHDHDHEHNHDTITTTSRSRGASLAIIAVPLVLGTLIPSQPLGAQAVSGSISTSSVDAQRYPDLQRRAGAAQRARLGARLQQDDASTFNGQPADVIGFVYVEPSFGTNQFMVARFAISCCVADATAIGVPVVWDQTPTLKQGEWLEVKGTFSVAAFQGDQKPVLQADQRRSGRSAGTSRISIRNDT